MGVRASALALVLLLVAAVSVKRDTGEPQFGAIWVECLVDTDRDTRIVSVLEVSVTTVRESGFSTPRIKSVAPRIIHAKVPAILVVLDGEPVWQKNGGRR